MSSIDYKYGKRILNASGQYEHVSLLPKKN